MKINGKTQTVILFRVYDGGAARIALENETLELAYATKRLSDREKELVLSEPDALEFGAGGKGRAFFAAGWQTDPATGKRAWTIPCLACGVRSVAHDQDEAEAASLRQDRERRQRERLERERIDRAAATEAAQRRRQEQDDLRAIAASVGKLDPATAGGVQSGTGKQTRKPRVEWSSNAQDRVANIWKDWKGCHNTQETGGRELDCYNENKADMPDTVKTFADFRACKECARKNGRIPKYNRKRRKSAG